MSSVALRPLTSCLARVLALLVVLALLLVGGCVTSPEALPDPEPHWRPLVEAALWQPVQAQSSFFEEPDKALPCNTELGVVAEELNSELVLSVMTQFCSHVTVAQPLLDAVEQGQRFRLRFWHSELTAPLESVASVVVLVAGELIWGEQFPIPSDGEYIDVELAAQSDFEEGQDVWFHVDNHGANEYSLIELSAR